MGMPQKTRLNLFLEIMSSNLPSIAENETWAFTIATLRAFIVSRAEEKDKKLQEWELMAIVSYIIFVHFLFFFESNRFWQL